AQVIYQQSADRLDCRPAPKRLAHSALFLSSKITEARLNVEAYVAASGMELDYALEIAIVEHIKFNFEIFDIYGFVLSMCKELKLEVEQKIAKLDSIYSDKRLSRIGFFEDGYSVGSMCLAMFEENEIELITGIYCIKANGEEIGKIKNEFWSHENI
ncbi:hypothetical protein PAEPH01_2301, partial [Pancytospora epiphaga]